MIEYSRNKNGFSTLITTLKGALACSRGCKLIAKSSNSNITVKSIPKVIAQDTLSLISSLAYCMVKLRHRDAKPGMKGVIRKCSKILNVEFYNIIILK